MRHDKTLELAKGFRGRNATCFRIARNKVDKALQYAFRDRKTKKRDFRSLWIQRINAGAREHGITYSQLMSGLNKCSISMNRKVLANLVINEPFSFKSLVDTISNATLARQVYRRIDEPVLRAHIATVIADDGVSPSSSQKASATAPSSPTSSSSSAAAAAAAAAAVNVPASSSIAAKKKNITTL